MKGIMCYYSGSGNTKLACQYITNKITEVKFTLFNVIKEGIPNFEQYGIVGFATFTDFLGVPQFFQTFIKNLPQQQNKPGFVFNTYGNMSGKTLKILDKLVTRKGFYVITGHSLHTPENFPPMIARGNGNEQAPDEKEMSDFNTFIAEFSQHLIYLKDGKGVEKGKLRLDLLNRVLPALPRIVGRKFMGRKYVDDALCTECGVCENVCPYTAIQLAPKPIFDISKCYGCWACYNHCPQKAIYTRKCRGVAHYPKPIAALREKLTV